MAVNLSPVGGVAAQFFTNNGTPLSGGKLYTYAAGTTTPQTTYTTSAGNVARTNPVVLDSAGRVGDGGEIWLTNNLQYKFVLKDSNDVLIATYDNIFGISSITLPIDSENVTYNPPFTNGTATTVEAKLAQSISVEDFGAVGDGVAPDTTAIQNALNALTSGQTLVFSKNYKITASLTITNKSRIRLTGKGRVFLSGAASGAYIFQLVGTIDDLEIDTMTLEGDNNASYTQVAIGCNSGQIVSNTRFHDLTIKNINVGLSHNANLGGSWTNGWAYNNYLENIKGTVPGSGYGIQAARAYNLHIYGNTINNASRHSIYVGKGQNLACLIENNTILNHRSTVADGSPRCAIDIGRVSGVTVANNTFRDCYDGQIYLGADTGEGEDCGNNLIIGNKFGTPKNAVPCIWAGEQLVPTTVFLSKIDILDNTFEQDCSLTTAAPIRILNGTQITVKNNRLRAYSVASTLPIFVEMGDTRYITSDAHIADITVTDNVATSDKGSTVAGSRLLYIVDQLCTGNSYYTAKNNSCPTWATEYYFEATPVNPNSKLKFYVDITYNVGSLAAGQNGTYAFSATGCKPTSQVTSKMQYSLQVAPVPVYTFGAKDDGPNAVFMTVANTNLTTASDQPEQTFRFFIEDF